MMPCRLRLSDPVQHVCGSRSGLSGRTIAHDVGGKEEALAAESGSPGKRPIQRGHRELTVPPPITGDYGEVYAYEVDGYGQYNADGRCQCTQPAGYGATSGYEPDDRQEVADNTRKADAQAEANPYLLCRNEAVPRVSAARTHRSWLRIWHIAPKPSRD